MKYLFIVLCLASCFFQCDEAQAAAGCPEDSVVEQAKKKHADFITDMYDTAVGQPSDSRERAACLGSIENLGDIFSMGVSLPSLDSVMEQVCSKADSMLQSAINNARDKITNLKDEVIDNNPVFSVVMSPDKVVSDLLGNLR